MPGCVASTPNVLTLPGLTTVCVMLGLLAMVKSAQVRRHFYCSLKKIPYSIKTKFKTGNGEMTKINIS